MLLFLVFLLFLFLLLLFLFLFFLVVVVAVVLVVVVFVVVVVVVVVVVIGVCDWCSPAACGVLSRSCPTAVFPQPCVLTPPHDGDAGVCVCPPVSCPITPVVHC